VNNFDSRTEEGDNTDDVIPSHGNFRIRLHDETRMNVARILQGVAESADNILSETHQNL
jgi:hypothetical protein